MIVANPNYGRCEGGPFNKKNLAHHGEVYRIAVQQSSGKAVPGLVASEDPDIEFGEYRWGGKAWIWVG